MPRKMLTMLFLTSLSIFALTCAALAQAKNQHAVEMQIRQVDAQWVAAVAKKDPKLIAQFYTENGALLAPNAPIAEGREAIAAAWIGFVGLKDFYLDFAPTKIDVSSSGDMAYEIGTYSLNFHGDKGPVQDKGKYWWFGRTSAALGKLPPISSTPTEISNRLGGSRRSYADNTKTRSPEVQVNLNRMRLKGCSPNQISSSSQT